MRSQYNKTFKNFARSLRKEQTDVEKWLWSQLRNRQLGGYKFKRQFPIGKYIVDFYCVEKKLVVELDGGQHLHDQKEYDEQRTKDLEKQGIILLRFWNNQITENLEGVLETILDALRKTSPNLS